MAAGVSSEITGVRKRKPHKKSRNGCRNCKLRAVKCDESKPCCQKCLSFGVSCNYGSRTSDDLQSALAGVFHIPTPQKNPCSTNETILGMINDAQTSSQTQLASEMGAGYQLGMGDLELLHKFQSRTVLTLGTAKGTLLYRKEAVRLACMNPFLMHSTLAITLMHDRYLSSSSQMPSPSTAESYHLYLGVSLFNAALSGPIHPSQRDGLWMTSAITSTMTLSHIEAKAPDEAWPLRPASPEDLDWLRMTDGLAEVWRIAEPLRPGSPFEKMKQEIADDHHPIKPRDKGICFFPSEVLTLFEIHPGSEPSNNPYYGPLCLMARMLPLPCNQQTIGKFMGFIKHVDPGYKRLLQGKDPRAMLLLSWWYAKVSGYSQWWIWRRAKLEGRALGMWLERWGGEEIGKLLDFPRSGWRSGEV